MGVTEFLHGTRIYLDANVFIYALEAYTPFVEWLGELFDAIDSGELQAATSELALAETLVKPVVDGDTALQQVYKDAFQTTDSLYVAPVSRAILIEAAVLRAKTGTLKLPDAIHVATARANQCQTFLTNDKNLKSIPDMRVMLLSDVVAT